MNKSQRIDFVRQFKRFLSSESQACALNAEVSCKFRRGLAHGSAFAAVVRRLRRGRGGRLGGEPVQLMGGETYLQTARGASGSIEPDALDGRCLACRDMRRRPQHLSAAEEAEAFCARIADVVHAWLAANAPPASIPMGSVG